MAKAQGPLVEWCDTCFANTEHYRTTRSAKMLALGITCKRCRQRACVRMSAKSRRSAEAPLRAAARVQRRMEKLRLEAEEMVARQAARIAAKHAPRYCPRCDAVTERQVQGRSTKCFPCEFKRKAALAARKIALRAAATSKISERHIANPHVPCPSGHHDWSPQGVCRACVRLRHRWNMTDSERNASAMWKRAKGRAFAKGLAFSIGPSDCVVPLSGCPVFGPFELGSGKPNGMSPSLDRIAPKLGYVPGNVIVISTLANTIKGAWTREQLRKVVECDAIWPA